MKQVARSESGDPLIRKISTNILDYYSTGHMNYLQEAQAIGKWVKSHVKYVRDASLYETIHSPKLMVQEIAKNGFTHGDCDCMATLIATLLLSIGQRPYFRAVKYANSNNFNHIYIVVFDKDYKGKKERLVIDAILKDRPIGSEVRHVYGEDILV